MNIPQEIINAELKGIERRIENLCCHCENHFIYCEIFAKIEILFSLNIISADQFKNYHLRIMAVHCQPTF